jgi:hypothetical protein
VTLRLATKDWALAVDGSQRDEPLVMLVAKAGEVAWCASPELPAPVLVAAVREALVAHRSRIGSVVAVSGPGSYIGVRGGLAAALGAAQSLACPLSLVGALEVIAAQADPGGEGVLALADAGRGGSFGQVLEPDLREGLPIRWLPLGRAQLLSRELPWPDSWAALRFAIGGPGAGRTLPAGTVSMTPIRDRRRALALVVAADPAPISGYDRVTADYAEPVGAR